MVCLLFAFSELVSNYLAEVALQTEAAKCDVTIQTTIKMLTTDHKINLSAL